MTDQRTFSDKLRAGAKAFPVEGYSFNECEAVSIVERARRRAYSALLTAYEEWMRETGCGWPELCVRTGWTEGRVNSALNFSSDMNLETIAMLAAAMGRDISLSFRPFPDAREGGQQRAAAQRRLT